jgi:hypothetical protein
MSNGLIPRYTRYKHRGTTTPIGIRRCIHFLGMHGLQEQANATDQPASAAPIQHLRLLCTSASGEGFRAKEVPPRLCKEEGPREETRREEEGPGKTEQRIQGQVECLAPRGEASQAGSDT